MGAPAYKPGLERVAQLCEALGNPQEKLRFVHIAGSNGKGSTASMLASFLTENKYKTGLFTSPHLVDFRERIRVNGQMISEEEVIAFCDQILTLDFEPSFFEISFCMALVHFVEQRCDICVIETGLGGRLDATNIIHPLVSVITTISLEHTQFLGHTLPEIATEKAGIIKENVPVVVGSYLEETGKVFMSKAKESKAELYFAKDFNFPIPTNFPLLGPYQEANFKTVLLTVDLLKKTLPLDMDKMKSALKNLRSNTGFQGRLQVVAESPRVIYDVSHNAEGIAATLQYFESDMGSADFHIIYGSSADKDLEEIFPLFPKNAHYYFTEFSNFRSARKEVLMQQAEKFRLKSKGYTSANEAFEAAKKNATKKGTLLVFGSFFLLHDFLK